jgi:hypothetical protein
MRHKKRFFIFFFFLLSLELSLAASCIELLYPFSPFGGRLANPTQLKSKAISKKKFNQILEKLSFKRDDTTSYRVELQNETPNSASAQHADTFIKETQELFKDQIRTRNENNFVTVTEYRRIKEEGDYPRNINIRIRSYRELSPDKNIHSSFDINPHDAGSKYAKLFIHPPGEIPVRFEFKKMAIDLESGKEIEGVKEKPTFFCLKSEADALLDPKKYFQMKDVLKEKIKKYRNTQNLVNRPEEVDSMIEAIGLIHKSGAQLENPKQAILYQRDSYVGPNDMQITVDKNIRFLDYKEGGLIRDFPLDSRVVEIKFPVYIMRELKRIHEMKPEARMLALKSNPYAREYETWRKFENLPTVEGAKRNTGKGARGVKIEVQRESTKESTLDIIRSE